MTTISQQYLELTIVLLVLAIILYIIYTLYRKNEKMHAQNASMYKELQSLKEENIALKIDKERAQKVLEELAVLKELEHKYYELSGEYNLQQEQLETLQQSLKSANEQLKELESFRQRSLSLEEALESKKAVLEELYTKMQQEFKLVSSELLEKKEQSLQKSSKEQIKLLLEPFESELKSFKNRLEQVHKNQDNSLATLRGELLQIKSLNQTLANEANALTRALKGEAKVQGNWGELILEKALESCGLREGVEYKREQSFKQEEGSLRADVILYLPEDKHIVIDAKVSLTDYTRLIQATTKEEAKRAKEAHVISIKRHIDTLASKQYHMLNSIKAPEFTLMFIPIEAAYLAAIESDSNLFEYAFERNVAVVTPTTLLTTLKTVGALWKLANHDKNMLKLASEAALMHDKFALFLEEFLALEQRLLQAQNAYDNAKGRLVSGQGSLYSKIKKVGNLSAKTKKDLPKILP